MTTLETTNPYAPGQIAQDDALPLDTWAKLLGVSRQAMDKRVFDITQQIEAGRTVHACRFSALPAEWQERLLALALERGARNAGELRAMVANGRRWQLDRPYMDYPKPSRDRAEAYWKAFRVYFARVGRDGEMVAIAATVAEHGRICDYTPAKEAARQFRRIRDKVMERGGVDATYGAYLDDKSKPKGPRTTLPEDLVVWIKGQLLDSRHGVRSVNDVHREACQMWQNGYPVPGLGHRDGDEVFPFTQKQFLKVAPGYTARIIAGKGKFAAKAAGLMAAPPLDWSNVEPMRVVMYDDKILDLQVLDDITGMPLRPCIYMAYDAGTRRVLSFSARPVGTARKLDVEGLFAAVLVQHGMGGAEAGFVSEHVFENGTVALDRKWDDVVQGMWPGRIQIRRTGMITGQNAAGDFRQKASGNFFGKGVIEAAMWALDNFAKRLPGATGNHYSNQPATLGDTKLTLEKLGNAARAASFKPQRTLLEESALTATMAQVLDWHENHALNGAYEASKRTGILPPMLYWTDFVALLGELFREFNNRRGHAMQGFATVREQGPSGMRLVTESPQDKATRMFAAMEQQGRSLMYPTYEDVAVLLHSLRRVTLNAQGAVLTLQPYGRLRFWSEESAAIRDVAQIKGGERTYLALVNPHCPDVLYLLANTTSQVPASATEMPEGFAPRLLEVLPLYVAPSAVDRDALEARAKRTHTAHDNLLREVAQGSRFIADSHTDRRQENIERVEPIRASIRAAAPPPGGEPRPLGGSGLGAQMTDAEVMLARAVTRRAQREEALSQSIPETGCEDLVL